jgi:hypothetical protein
VVDVGIFGFQGKTVFLSVVQNVRVHIGIKKEKDLKNDPHL